MRQSCLTACLLLTGTGVLIPFAGAKADEQAAGKQALDTWRAWQEMHPLPLPENDEAEEKLLRELFGCIRSPRRTMRLWSGKSGGSISDSFC
jgi:hypothetical protein